MPPRTFRRRALSRGPNGKAKKHVEEQLTQIYENPDGSMPDMKHIERRERHRARRALFVLLFSAGFLAAVAWAGFFIFPPGDRFQEDEVNLSVSGPETVVSGEEARYRIRYRNDQSRNLGRVVVQVRYPEGFVFSTSTPAGASGDEWVIGALGAGESGFIDISGKLFGDQGAEQSFRVFLNYTPDNFSSEFQKVATARVAIAPPPLTVGVSGPAEVVSGGTGEIVVSVLPASDALFEHLAVEIVPGASFSKKTATPADEPSSPYRWLFDQISGEQKIILSGIFVGGSEDARESAVTVILRGWKDAARTGDGYIYGEATHRVRIIQTALQVSLVINGTTGNTPVQPGDILNASVVVKNGGEELVERAAVRAIFDAPSAGRQSILDWKNIDDPADGEITGEQLNTDTRRGVIAWDARQVPELARLLPGEEVVIDFHLPVKNAADTDLADFRTAVITASSEVQAGAGAERLILAAAPLTLTLVSDTAFETAHAALEAADDGREVHILSWTIRNSFHELKDLVVETDVYGDVTITTTTASLPAGALDYDEAEKKLRWRITTLPTVVDVLSADIPVILNRRNSTQTHLTSPVRFRAIDAIANHEILKVEDAVAL